MDTATVLDSRPRPPKTAVKSTPNLKITPRTLSRLNHIFQMLADRSRLTILLALAQNGEMHVTALCQLLGQSQPAVSHHLRLLRVENLVTFRRDGKKNYYRVDSTFLCELLEQFFSDSSNAAQKLVFEEFSLAYSRK